MTFIYGMLLGGSTIGWFSWRVHRRFAVRLARNHQQEMMAEWLEKRREATDSGHDTEVVAGAGPNATESGLFPVRPGRLYLDHLNSKVPLDIPPDRTKVDGV